MFNNGTDFRNFDIPRRVKIDPETGSGLVAFFTVTPGKMVHYTRKLEAERIERVEGADHWTWQDGRLKLEVNLGYNDARVVYVIGSKGH